MEATERQDWFEKIWEYREETIYPEFFGELEKRDQTAAEDRRPFHARYSGTRKGNL